MHLFNHKLFKNMYRRRGHVSCFVETLMRYLGLHVGLHIYMKQMREDMEQQKVQHRGPFSSN